MGLRRARHNWATSLSLLIFMHWRRKWQPTPVFLPGKSQGLGSLVGCHLWGPTESDTTEATNSSSSSLKKNKQLPLELLSLTQDPTHFVISLHCHSMPERSINLSNKLYKTKASDQWPLRNGPHPPRYKPHKAMGLGSGSILVSAIPLKKMPDTKKLNKNLLTE